MDRRARRILALAVVGGGVAVAAWAAQYGQPTADVPRSEAAEPEYHHHALVQSKVGFYAVFVPPGYDAPDNQNRHYPIVVILHGLGSNEINHGRLSTRLGVEDALYVAPRAPHASHEAFLGARQPGFSAWPQYPTAWGSWDSDSFPNEELADIDMIGLYTDWIARTIVEARKRYRSDGRKAVVVGHSQGATIAFSFALRRPDLVRAFFGHAGWYGWETLNEKNAEILKINRVVPFISHYEGDRVVSISESRKLLAFLRKYEVPHRKALLEAGNHSFGAEVLEAAQAFIRDPRPSAEP